MDIECKQCGILFSICSSCFRGHCYCNSTCKAKGYEQRRRIARKKYNSTREAKLDHRDRQNKYRASDYISSRSVKFVLDKTSDKRLYSLNSTQQKNNEHGYCIACGIKT